MTTRHEEIDEEIAHLRRLAFLIVDERTLEGINDLVADLEAERAELSQN